MEVRKRQPIGVELVRRGIVTENDIENALKYQKEHPNKKLGDILYILDVCEPTMLIEAIGEILGTKGILLTPDKVKIQFDEYLALEVAKKNKAIPFDVRPGIIRVCFASNVKNKEVDAIRMMFLNKGLVMESYITFEDEIDRILKLSEGKVKDDLDTSKVRKDDSVTTLLDSIIKTAIERRASDIHIEPMADIVRVRYRIDGELFTVAKIAKEKQPQLIGRIKAISNMHQEKQESQDRKNFII